MNEPILTVEDLHTYFVTREGITKAVNGVSLTLKEDSILGIVGESGSGKTVTALSILRLVPFPGQIVKGVVNYKGRDLLKMSDDEMRRIRGQEISLIFQDAGAALNPVISVGSQIEEIVLEHTSMGKRQARDMAVHLLTQMGMPDARDMLRRYPFQLSGGQAQRVLMAIGVALKPRVLIADEPTSALDVTLQAEILQRMRELRQQNHSAIMLITHDLGVIAQMADEVSVMYAGTVVEHTDTRTLFNKPLHPYTWGLFQALPRIDVQQHHLQSMPGAPPTMLNPGVECPFLERCPKAINQCRISPRPRLIEHEPGHWAACYNPMTRA